MATFALLWFLGQAGEASAIKFSGLSILAKQNYQGELFALRADLAKQHFPEWLIKLSINTYTLRAKKLVSNFARAFSPQFLFLQGGGNLAHNLPGVANFSLLGFLLLFFGFPLYCYQLKSRGKNQYLFILMAWLCLASVPAIITFEPDHSTRLAAIIPVMATLIALSWLGLITLWQKWQALILLALLLVTYQTFLVYYFIAPYQRLALGEWLMPRLGEALLPIYQDYDRVYLPLLKRSPYIFLLFDWQYPPAKLADNLEFLPADEEGFMYASRLENIYFSHPPELSASGGGKILFLRVAQEVDNTFFADGRFSLQEKFTSDLTDEVYYLFSFNEQVATHSSLTNTDREDVLK